MITTDEMYNALSRAIEYKLTIYFTGIAPVEVTSHDYLMDSTLLEEMHSETDTPFGDATSNELCFTLANTDGRFNPLNASGPYYGKIVKGTKVVAYVKPTDSEDYEYDEVGTFYITDWQSNAGSYDVSVSANDYLYTLFEKKVVPALISTNKSFNEMFYEFFTALNIMYTSDDLSELASYSYFDGTNKEILNSLLLGAQADCFCNHEGSLVLEALFKARSLRATITDANQIQTISVPQSIIVNYGGSNVVLHSTQESEQTCVLSLSARVFSPGTTLISNVSLTEALLIRLTGYKIVGSTSVTITAITASTNTVSLSVLNDTTLSATVDIEIYGVCIEEVLSSDSDDDDNLLEVDNKYIQTSEYAAVVKSRLTRFVSLTAPIVKLTTRGNALLCLGDKIRVVSAKYNIDFTGIIYRKNAVFSGGYSEELSLLDASILEEV